MNKNVFSLIVFLFLSISAYASEIKIAPIAVYDSNGNKINPPNNPSKAIHNELDKNWFEGLINFSVVSENNQSTPVTIIDANKICITENADYLIYGYIR